MENDVNEKGVDKEENEEANENDVSETIKKSTSVNE